MANFRCMTCGYQFKSAEKKKCPYCGKEDVEKEKNADELIDNVRVE